MSAPTVGSAFTGIGGFDLGLRAAGFGVRWTVELADLPDEVLARRFPDVERFRDVRELERPPKVGVVTGGFPCQDIAAPGKGTGITGERSGLWSDLARLIGAVEPDLALIENVPLLLIRGMEVVVHDLVELGYCVEWDCLPAAAFGAPHLRDRVWIAAHRREAPAMFGDPAGLFPHDWHELAATDAGWLRWPRAGFVQGADLLELEPLAPVAAVKRGATVPTPQAADGSGARYDGGALRRAQASSESPRSLTRPSGAKAALTLATYARGIEQGIYPTPRAAEELLPTPKSSPSGPDYARAGREGSGGDDLATRVARDTPGQLNPDWVEWLMGFPIGWTNPAVSDDELRAVAWEDGEPDGVPRVTGENVRRGERLTALGNALIPRAAAWLGQRAIDRGIV